MLRLIRIVPVQIIQGCQFSRNLILKGISANISESLWINENMQLYTHHYHSCLYHCCLHCAPR